MDGTQGGGPGTELKVLLEGMGIFPTEDCPCDERALLMDMNGPDWCQEHIEEIVDWLEEEACNRQAWFRRWAGRALVRQAIYNFRMKDYAYGGSLL
jgi:hypothetical protein